MRIDLLGPIRVRFGDELVSKFQTQKTAALLAYVATNPGRAFPREQVAELLWPDGDPVAIRNRLNQAVSSLRRQLEPFGIDPLISDAQCIGLKEGVAETDIEEFRRLLGGKGADSEESYRRTLELYRGDFLEGADEEWAIADRIKYLDGYIQSLTKLMKLLVDAKRFEEAIEIAHQRLEVNVRDERNHRALMKLFLLADRPSAAMAQFRELESILAKDGAAPSARARDLFETARRAGEGDSDSFSMEPAEPTVRRVPGLPASANRFVGREADLARLQEFFDGGARVVALVGIGGIGKNRLACEYGWRVAERCQNRVIRIDADGDGELDEAKLAEKISRVYFGAPLRDLSAWSAESGECLLILDDAEKVSQSLLDRFLNRLPGLRVILCSRQRLNLPAVPELAIGPLDDLGRELYEARAANSDIDEETEKLLKALNGIPLAIELAAGISRQSGRLDAFVQLPVMMEEHGSTTLAEIIKSSISGLEPEKREVLEVLAAWPEPLAPEAMDGMLPQIDVLLALDRLESRALVAADRDSDIVRFRILPLIQLAVDSSRSEEIVGRLSGVFETRLERIWPFSNLVARNVPNFRAAARALSERGELKRSAYMDCHLAASLAALNDGEAERERIMTLLAETDSKADPVYWARLRTARSQFLDQTLLDDLAELEESARILAENGFWVEWASNRVAAATALARGGKLAEGREVAESILERDYGPAGSPVRARAFLRLGHIAVDSGDDLAAEQAYRMAMNVDGTSSNPLLHASILDSLANLYNLNGKLDEAREYSHNSLSSIAKLGFAGQRRRIVPLQNLADTERLASNYEMSFQYMEEAYSLGEIASMRQREHLVSGALLLLALGDEVGAAQLMGSADRLGADPDTLRHNAYNAPIHQVVEGRESSYKEGKRQTYEEAVRWLGTRARERLYSPI